MFAKFKMNKEKYDYTFFNSGKDYYDIGLSIRNKHDIFVEHYLENILSVDGTIDAETIEQEWFPPIDAHVFFSHSHDDEKYVLQLAGFLYDHYKITSFIDSTVWGHVDDLLKQIDDKYCRNDDNSTYNYTMRNQSTAHVHMILQGALAKMIDRTECIVFVNTPNSLDIQDIENRENTSSPWIYNELLMASTFPPSNPMRYGITVRMSARDSVQEHVQIPIVYTPKLKGFKSLELMDIIAAGIKVDQKDARKVLNQLYCDKGLI